MNKIIVSILFLAFSQFAYSQNQFSPEQKKVYDYLQTYFEKINKRPGSISNEFEEFSPIESKLETDLLKNLPKHRFFVVKTYYGHWFPRDGRSKILVVTNAETGEPIAHRWALWYSGFSESFAHILEVYNFESEKDAKDKIEILSKIILSLSRDEQKIGEIKVKDNAFWIDLENNWRIMKIGFKKNQFKKIIFINPKMNEEDKSEESGKH